MYNVSVNVGWSKLKKYYFIFREKTVWLGAGATVVKEVLLKRQAVLTRAFRVFGFGLLVYVFIRLMRLVTRALADKNKFGRFGLRLR
jgi:hypothetical protein